MTAAPRKLALDVLSWGAAIPLMLIVVYVAGFGPIVSFGLHYFYPADGWRAIQWFYAPLLKPTLDAEPWTGPFRWYLELLDVQVG